MTRRHFDAVTAALVVLTACAPPDAGRSSWAPSASDWPAYGGDDGGIRYSALATVTPENVGHLEVAWTWDTGDVPIPAPMRPIPGQDVRAGNFEVTPLVIGDTLYVSTPFNRVVALDAATGHELWAYDPGTSEWGKPPNGTGLVHRGVAVWTGNGGRRIFLNTRWRLIALDAASGRPIQGFGHDGEVDLTESAAVAHQPPPLHPDVAAGGLRRPGHRGQRRLGRLRVPRTTRRATSRPSTSTPVS